MHRGKGIGSAAMLLVCTFMSSSVVASPLPPWGSQVLSSDPVFDFNSDVVGKATPFTDTALGLGATFTSSGDPGGFAVTPHSLAH
jgi:hypothetical protein